MIDRNSTHDQNWLLPLGFSRQGGFWLTVCHLMRKLCYRKELPTILNKYLMHW